MPFSREAYVAFEEIVGSENVSDDPALLDSYAYIYPHTGETLLLQQIEKKQGHQKTQRPD